MKVPKIPLGPVWLAFPAVLVLISAWSATDYPLDFWLHVNASRQNWEHGALVEHDTFTHTVPGSRVLNQPWLAQLAMYGLFRAGGFKLVQFVTGLCYGVAIFAVSWLAWKRCGRLRIASVAGLAAAVLAISNLAVRPQAFSALLFAVELVVLWTAPGRWWAVGVVALLELVWTNSHGAFPLGTVLPLLFAAAAAVKVWRADGGRAVVRSRPVQCYLAASLAAAATMFVNPHGLATAGYVTGVTTQASQRLIEEWLPTSLATFTGKTFVGSLPLVIIVLGLSRRRADPIELLLMASFVLLAARSQRMVIWWGLVLAPALAPHLAATAAVMRRVTASRDERTGWNAAIAAAVAALLLLSNPWTRSLNPLLPAAKRVEVSPDEPRDAVQFVQQQGWSGRAYHPMEWGSYLTWHLDPHVKVFVDARIESFPDSVWKDYLEIGNSPVSSEQKLEQYEVDLVIWDHRRKSPLPDILQNSPRWNQVYRDHNSVVFLHTPRSHQFRDDLAGTP